MTEHRVVVGVSDAPANAHTLAWAVRESKDTNAQLVVVRAALGPRRDRLGTMGWQSLRSLELVDPALARAVAAARDRLGDARVVIVVDGDRPSDVLARAAEPADVIAVGPPAHPGWWARASTTYQLITRAPCPVIVVHDAGQTVPDGLGAYFRHHVVVGVDGSPAARAALGFGFAFAAAHGLPLVAVNVGHHVDTEVWFDDAWLETHLATDPAAAVALAEEIEPWHLKYPAVPVKRALVAGRPADGFRHVSQAAAVLAVGVSTGLQPLGGVSRSLAEHAPCPVAIARPIP